MSSIVGEPIPERLDEGSLAASMKDHLQLHGCLRDETRNAPSLLKQIQTRDTEKRDAWNVETDTTKKRTGSKTLAHCVAMKPNGSWIGDLGWVLHMKI